MSLFFTHIRTLSLPRSLPSLRGRGGAARRGGCAAPLEALRRHSAARLGACACVCSCTEEGKRTHASWGHPGSLAHRSVRVCVRSAHTSTHTHAHEHARAGVALSALPAPHAGEPGPEDRRCRGGAARRGYGGGRCGGMRDCACVFVYVLVCVWVRVCGFLCVCARVRETM